MHRKECETGSGFEHHAHDDRPARSTAVSDVAYDGPGSKSH